MSNSMMLPVFFVAHMLAGAYLRERGCRVRLQTQPCIGSALQAVPVSERCSHACACAVGAFMLAVFKYVSASSWCLTLLCGRRDKDELPVLLGLLPAPAKRAPPDKACAGDSED
jgi:hypothetical protein